jgi:hypothetical protein
MGAGSFKNDPGFIDPINQQPVRLNMAFPPVPEIADE